MDTYISIDVETTGKIPSQHKLLSIGAVPIINGEVKANMGLSIFIQSIDLYAFDKGSVGPEWDPDTYDWWMHSDRANAWTMLRDGIDMFGLNPRDAASAFYHYVKALPGPISMVADPATFDAGFIWELLYRGCGQRSIDELGRMRMVDIRTMRMCRYGVEYSAANRTLVPDSVTEDAPITHDAFADAYCQALQFKYLKNLKAHGERIVPWND